METGTQGIVVSEMSRALPSPTSSQEPAHILSESGLERIGEFQLKEKGYINL